MNSLLADGADSGYESNFEPNGHNLVFEEIELIEIEDEVEIPSAAQRVPGDDTLETIDLSQDTMTPVRMEDSEWTLL